MNFSIRIYIQVYLWQDPNFSLVSFDRLYLLIDIGIWSILDRFLYKVRIQIVNIEHKVEALHIYQDKSTRKIKALISHKFPKINSFCNFTKSLIDKFTFLISFIYILTGQSSQYVPEYCPSSVSIHLHLPHSQVP